VGVIVCSRVHNDGRMGENCEYAAVSETVQASANVTIEREYEAVY